MYRSFPLTAATLICCPADGQPLLSDRSSLLEDERIASGALVCNACGSRYPIVNGILQLADSGPISLERSHERKRRDAEAHEFAEPDVTLPASQAEIAATMRCLAPRPQSTMLELGCGTGRYTRILVGICRLIVAADFSMESLVWLARALPSDAPCALVKADVTNFRVCPGTFDLVLSTLTSNLPTRADRQSMLSLASRSLKSDGRLVHSMHHFSLRARLRGEVASGHYSPGGIYRYLFKLREAIMESREYFGQVKCTGIVVFLPFSYKLRLPLVQMSAILERLPLLNRLGELLLLIGKRPISRA